jgi:Acyltransferase
MHDRRRAASRASERGGELPPVDVVAVSPARVPDLASDRARDRLARFLDPLAWVTRPKLYGVERIPAGGVLLVGNHTIYGLDVPFMIATLWRDHRIAVRALGDHLHYVFPVWRELLELGAWSAGPARTSGR